MLRLWQRVGIFRTLSVAVLVLGVISAVWLVNNRSGASAGGTGTAIAANPVNDLQAVPDGHAKGEALSGPAAEAQGKAEQAASVVSERVKAAETETRKNEEASRSGQRSSPSAKPPSSPAAKRPKAPVGPIPASCASYSGNKAIGCKMMLEAGFGLDQMPCLDKLWMKESGWRTNAHNPSGAHGIAQAKPGSKMGAGWEDDPVVQIRWGLGYIKGRYSTPCGAWSAFQSKGWY